MSTTPVVALGHTTLTRATVASLVLFLCLGCDTTPIPADAGPTLPLCDNVPTDTQNDPDHCGYCTWQCLPGERCVAGKCECAPGRGLCFDVCEDLENDPKNCGKCRRECPAGQACVGGACCRTSDPRTCCRESCKLGELCTGNLCCPIGWEACGGKCADIAWDPEHCGGCGNACPDDQRCVGGTCRPCGAPLVGCRHECVEVSTSLSDCGACGRACAGTDAQCAGGRCRLHFGVTAPSSTLIGWESTIAASGSWLYAISTPAWGYGPRLHRIGRQGGTLDLVMEVGDGHITGTATDIYFFDTASRINWRSTPNGPPVALSDPTPGAKSTIALGGGYAYFGGLRAPLSGGPPATVVSEATLAPNSAAADPLYAYFLVQQGVVRIPHSLATPPELVGPPLPTIPQLPLSAARAGTVVPGGIVYSYGFDLLYLELGKSWSSRLHAELLAPPAARGSQVYALRRAGWGQAELVRVDPALGLSEVLGMIPIPGDGRPYVVAVDADAVYVLDEKNLWTIAPP